MRINVERQFKLNRRMCVTGVLGLLAGCAAVPTVSADVVLVSQAVVTDASRVGLGFYSSSHARPTRNYKRGDDFTLDSAVELTRVRWWGQSEGRLFDDLRNFDRYTIEIFEADTSGGAPLPGALVWSREFAAGSLAIAATGRTASASGAAEHRYEADLAEPVTLQGGRGYLLAISARSVNPRGDAWQWQDSEFYGGHGASYSYASGAWSSFQDTDSAFELVGRRVPAPGAVTLLGAAIARLASRRVRSA